MSETLRGQMRADLKTAFKNRDKVAVEVLRTLLAAFENAEAVPLEQAREAIPGKTNDVPRRVLSGEEIGTILQREYVERVHARDLYARLEQTETAERLAREVEVIAHYLPSNSR